MTTNQALAEQPAYIERLRTENSVLRTLNAELVGVLKMVECEIVTLKPRLADPYRANMEAVQRAARAVLAKAEAVK